MNSVADYLTQANKTLFSFEVLPPLKGNAINKVYNIIDDLLEFDPKYINITAHRDEVIHKKNKNGSFTEHRLSRRPGTVAVASAILNKYKINVVPHVICSGFSKIETEYALIDLSFLGIFDLLLLKGDNLKNKVEIIPEGEQNQYAIDLIHQVEDFNKGKYSDGTTFDPLSHKFTYGVAGYPEKHGDSSNLAMDIEHLKNKVKAGAKYIVTQMFFDNQKFIDFKRKVKKEGINVPIIPGIKPLTKLRQVKLLPSLFGIELPLDFLKEAEKCKTDQQMQQVGEEWAIHQCKELIKNKVPSLHFYTMLASQSIKRIAKEIY